MARTVHPRRGSFKRRGSPRPTAAAEIVPASTAAPVGPPKSPASSASRQEPPREAQARRPTAQRDGDGDAPAVNHGEAAARPRRRRVLQCALSTSSGCSRRRLTSARYQRRTRRGGRRRRRARDVTTERSRRLGRLRIGHVGRVPLRELAPPPVAHRLRQPRVLWSVKYWNGAGSACSSPMKSIGTAGARSTVAATGHARSRARSWPAARRRRGCRSDRGSARRRRSARRAAPRDGVPNGRACDAATCCPW